MMNQKEIKNTDLNFDAGKQGSLKISNLCVARGLKLIIDKLNHFQSQGEMCCLVGPNGSGKSTLLLALAGRLPIFSGGFICSFPRIYIGHSDGLSDSISGEKNLTDWGKLYGFSVKKNKIEQALSNFETNSFANVPVKLLSRGQKRRLALTRLHLAPPKSIWLLDEPNVGLDARAVKTLDKIINLHVAAGGMVLVATHTPVAKTTPQRKLRLKGAIS